MKILERARNLLHPDTQPSELAVEVGKSLAVKGDVVLKTPMNDSDFTLRLSNDDRGKRWPREVNAQITGVYQLEYNDLPNGHSGKRFEVELQLDGKLYRVRDDLPIGYLHLKLGFEPDRELTVTLDNLRFPGGRLRPIDPSEATEVQTHFTDSRPVRLRTGERNDHVAMVTALTGRDPITGE